VETKTKREQRSSLTHDGQIVAITFMSSINERRLYV